MKRRSALPVLVLAISGWSGLAHAHAVDAVVEQTTIAISDDAITVHFSLTPGSERAEAFLRESDRDGNGAFSDDEAKRVTDKVQQHLSLSVDGRPLPLTVVSTTMPALAAIREGTGVVAIDFTAPLGAPDNAPHAIVIENHDAPDGVVYLANVLRPSNGELVIVSQDRTPSQAVFRVGYRRTSPVSPWVMRIGGGAVLTVAAALLLLRARGRQSSSGV